MPGVRRGVHMDGRRAGVLPAAGPGERTCAVSPMQGAASSSPGRSGAGWGAAHVPRGMRAVRRGDPGPVPAQTGTPCLLQQLLLVGPRHRPAQLDLVTGAPVPRRSGGDHAGAPPGERFSRIPGPLRCRISAGHGGGNAVLCVERLSALARAFFSDTCFASGCQVMHWCCLPPAIRWRCLCVSSV